MSFALFALCGFVSQTAHQPDPASVRNYIVAADSRLKAKELLAGSAEEVEQRTREAGLVLVKSGTSRFYIQKELWNPPRLEAALQLLRFLGEQDLSQSFAISSLPPNAKRQLLERLNGMVKRTDGQPVFSATSQLQATVNLSFTYDVGGVTRSRNGLDLVANPPQNRSGSSPLIQVTAPDPRKDVFRIEATEELRDHDYYEMVSVATRLLFERRNELIRKYEEAEAALTASRFPQTTELPAPETPFSQLSGSLQTLITSWEAPQGTTSAVIEQIRLRDCKRNLILNFSVKGGPGIFLGPRALFDY